MSKAVYDYGDRETEDPGHVSNLGLGSDRAKSTAPNGCPNLEPRANPTTMTGYSSPDQSRTLHGWARGYSVCHAPTALLALHLGRTPIGKNHRVMMCATLIRRDAACLWPSTVECKLPAASTMVFPKDGNNRTVIPARCPKLKDFL
ncbi:hypothetical protein AAL_01063 [Moelleriella libera RCEF 2490]|uniref:Uncharacterized protein n=1 Tax=Moelleriella libera RCEF 2490 TaxID=1081109 RepID=A0A166VF92_9HYPO|nr:hypothetical protein AAL_01063 [Moelleriella libera RCEF 2490]